MREKILVIAAHADDEVLGVGGTIMKHVAEGGEVFIFIIGEGVAARHGAEGVENAKKNAISAAQVLGVPPERVSFGGYLLNKRFDETNLTELIVSIEEKIKKIEPEVIYTHHFGDANTDHGIVHKATMAAVRPIAVCNKKIKRVLSYEVLSSTDQVFQLESNSFHPNIYSDISPFLEKKVEALNCYLDEVKEPPHPRSGEAVRALAKYRGFSVMKGAAEAFMMLREVI